MSISRETLFHFIPEAPDNSIELVGLEEKVRLVLLAKVREGHAWEGGVYVDGERVGF